MQEQVFTVEEENAQTMEDVGAGRGRGEPGSVLRASTNAASLRRRADVAASAAVFVVRQRVHTLAAALHKTSATRHARAARTLRVRTTHVAACAAVVV